jgi:hypothetical protein
MRNETMITGLKTVIDAYYPGGLGNIIRGCILYNYRVCRSTPLAHVRRTAAPFPPINVSVVRN